MKIYQFDKKNKQWIIQTSVNGVSRIKSKDVYLKFSVDFLCKKMDSFIKNIKKKLSVDNLVDMMKDCKLFPYFHNVF